MAIVWVDALDESVDGVGDEDLLLLSERNVPVFLVVATSGHKDPTFSVTSSCAKFLTARDSGFGFKVEVTPLAKDCFGVEDSTPFIPGELPIGGKDDIIALQFCSSSACSGPSSGMVG